MSSLLLRYLAYLGPDREVASIDLKPGLNVVCGASETGKSFLVESINFMLGGQKPLRDIPERAGYDRVRLMIESKGWKTLYLERSIEGGDFSAYEKELRDGDPQTEALVLRAQHSGAREDTLSHALLERIGLTDKRLRKNSAGKTQTLSIRDLIRLAIVTEEKIQQPGSPLLSGQYVRATPEYAAFKLLLTGTDDSALVSAGEVAGRKDSVSGKIELLDEMIKELQHEIQEEGLDEGELKDQYSKLTRSIEEQDATLEQAQAALDNLLETRAAVANKIKHLRARRLEIDELTHRFELLGQHYRTDLKRLEAIQESGSLLVHLEHTDCPLCGAAPGDQHLGSGCDGNTEQVILAASAEMEKINRLQRELTDTVASLKREDEKIAAELPRHENEYRIIESKLNEIAKPAVSTKRTSYNELVSKKVEVTISLNKFARLEQLSQHREELEWDDADTDGPSETRTSVPKNTLNKFSKMIERILSEWHFPNASRVFFNESSKTFKLMGRNGAARVRDFVPLLMLR